MAQQSGVASLPHPALPTKRTARRGLLTRQLIWSIFGILAVGILVPCLLTWLHAEGDLFPAVFLDSNDDRVPWKLSDLFALQLIAVVGCGPGALLLGSLLFVGARRSRRLADPRESGILRFGALLGAVMAFGNLPGYLCIFFYDGEEFTVLRIALLFLVTGATCGTWIAWQAYRERHPERGFFPCFSLRTLIIGVLSWGVLLAVFMP